MVGQLKFRVHPCNSHHQPCCIFSRESLLTLHLPLLLGGESSMWLFVLKWSHLRGKIKIIRKKTSSAPEAFVDGWNPARQSRLVVYPSIYKVSYIPSGARFLSSTVHSFWGGRPSASAARWFIDPPITPSCWSTQSLSSPNAAKRPPRELWSLGWNQKAWRRETKQQKQQNLMRYLDGIRSRIQFCWEKGIIV